MCCFLRPLLHSWEAAVRGLFGQVKDLFSVVNVDNAGGIEVESQVAGRPCFSWQGIDNRLIVELARLLGLGGNPK